MCISLAGLCVVLCGLPPATALLPTAANISYTGRWDLTTDPQNPTFSWASTQFAFRIIASAVDGSFTPPSDGMRLLVLVDGVEHAIHKVKGGRQNVPLAKGLSRGLHSISVWKVTEDNTQQGSQGVATFHGLSLPSGGSWAAPPPRPTRRLEFVGDSDTAGWCADGDKKSGDAADKEEDSYRTWARQLSSALNAEMMAEAISGYGVSKSSTPIQPCATRTHPFLAGSSWDFTSWTPDGIVLLIGPNDERRRRLKGAEIGLGGKSFIKDYLDLMAVYVTAYAHLPRMAKPKMIHVCGGSLNGLDPCPDIKEAIAQFNTAHAEAGDGWVSSFTSITKAHWHMINANSGRSEYNGCDGHYNKKGHAILAVDILPDLRRILGWDQEALKLAEA